MLLNIIRQIEGATAVELEPPAKKVRFNRGCPACESGMNAPGIRHSASCKNAFEGEQLTISGSLSPLWGCNLALVRQEFIESSVVKLDYGKLYNRLK